MLTVCHAAALLTGCLFSAPPSTLAYEDRPGTPVLKVLAPEPLSPVAERTHYNVMVGVSFPTPESWSAGDLVRCVANRAANPVHPIHPAAAAAQGGEAIAAVPRPGRGPGRPSVIVVIPMLTPPARPVVRHAAGGPRTLSASDGYIITVEYYRSYGARACRPVKTETIFTLDAKDTPPPHGGRVDEVSKIRGRGVLRIYFLLFMSILILPFCHFGRGWGIIRFYL